MDDIEAIDSPALVIYKDRVQQNIAAAIALVGDASKLRPHVKTHKCAEVTQLMLQAGITKFKCTTIAEAEMLAQCGAQDILLAYQPTGPKIERLLQLMQHYPQSRFSCLINSADAAIAISDKTAASSLVIDMLLDIYVGMNRTGVLPQHAVMLYEACKELTGITIVGLHGYDGHINDTDLTIRKQQADAVYYQLKDVEQGLPHAGSSACTVVIGGSPTFGIHATRNDVECSPGTFVYWDRSYSEAFPDLLFLPAALIVSRVVSIINDTLLCLDLGHKSVAAENTLQRRVYFLNGEDLMLVDQSEEHRVVSTPNAHRYTIGDVLYSLIQPLWPFLTASYLLLFYSYA